jgi:carbon monoxide dehydrogenase subunit G
MEVTGKYTLYAPREWVWDALLDPDMLKRSVPGCERLVREGDDRYRVRVNINVAAVKGVYDGTLRLSDAVRPDHYHINVEGSGARGVLRGEGEVRLEASAPNRTTIHYAGQAQLGGTIASVGGRIAQGAAELLLKQYFARLADLLAEEQAGRREPTKTTASVAEAAATPNAGARIPTHQAADARRAIAGDGATAALSGVSTNKTDVTSVPAMPPRGPLMRFTRRAGLSDGTIESERRIARTMIGGFLGAAIVTAVGAAIVLGLAGRGGASRR